SLSIRFKLELQSSEILTKHIGQDVVPMAPRDLKGFHTPSRGNPHRRTRAEQLGKDAQFNLLTLAILGGDLLTAPKAEHSGNRLMHDLAPALKVVRHQAKSLACQPDANESPTR